MPLRCPAERPPASSCKNSCNGLSLICDEFFAVHFDLKRPSPLYAFHNSSGHLTIILAASNLKKGMRTFLSKNDLAILPGRGGLFQNRETKKPPPGDQENSEPEFSTNVDVVQKQVPMQPKSPLQNDLGHQ
jgi:hypothetical protein